MRQRKTPSPKPQVCKRCGARIAQGAPCERGNCYVWCVVCSDAAAANRARRWIADTTPSPPPLRGYGGRRPSTVEHSPDTPH